MPRDYSIPPKPPASVRLKLKELHQRRHVVDNLIRAFEAYADAQVGPRAKERTAA